MDRLASIFSKDGKWSSKRVFGGLGICVILFCLIKCTYDHSDLPSGTEIIFTGCVGLLGCDSVMNAISKKINGTEEGEQ